MELVRNTAAIAVLLLLMAAQPVFAARITVQDYLLEQQPENIIEAIIKYSSSQAAHNRKLNSITVHPLRMENRIGEAKDKFSRYYYLELSRKIGELANKNNLIFVDRDKFKYILSEHKQYYNLIDLYDPRDQLKIGQFKPADFLVIGSYWNLNKSINIKLEVIDLARALKITNISYNIEKKNIPDEICPFKSNFKEKIYQYLMIGAAFLILFALYRYARSYFSRKLKLKPVKVYFCSPEKGTAFVVQKKRLFSLKKIYIPMFVSSIDADTRDQIRNAVKDIPDLYNTFDQQTIISRNIEPGTYRILCLKKYSSEYTVKTREISPRGALIVEFG